MTIDEARAELTRCGRLVSNELAVLDPRHNREIFEMVATFISTHMAYFRAGMLDPIQLRKLETCDDVLEWQERFTQRLEKLAARSHAN